jgi:hypothetical protein
MISIDTVYQKVLALANKEQRGYITPQEYNLFANHAQMEIFEQYFYDINQFNRVPGNSTEYSDMLSVLQEKLNIFEVSVEDISLTGTITITGVQFNPIPAPSQTSYSTNWANGTNSGFYFFAEKEEVDVFLNDSTWTDTFTLYPELAINQYRNNQLIYSGLVRMWTGGNSSNPPSPSGGPTKIHGRKMSTNGAGGWIGGPEPSTWQVGDVITSTLNHKVFTTTPNLHKLGTLINSANGCEIERVNNNEYLQMKSAPLTKPTLTRPVYVNRSKVPGTILGLSIYPESIDKIDISYTRKPNTVNWSYVVINNKPLYTPTGSVHFELHASEEVELVYRILGLAGIAIEKPQLTQVATGLQGAAIQQEKQ